MGNTQTPGGAEHYRVQIVDDGSGSDGGGVPDAGAVPDGAVPDGGAARGGGTPSAPVPFWRRTNLALVAAGVLVGAFLAVGLWWLTSSYPMPKTYYDPTGTQQLIETSSQIAMNLYGIGAFLLLLGIMGAFTLLVVQSARFRRRP
ncbi:hypothetical protein ITX31_04065 [Arthrobacter gandavensis]|uniref:hypothetical protein n=1 Tax=Arthrobacter gandavensis TaxID=169960 RepID=UPI00188ED20B|nr:hypothetical protein [Arthrobacter gandavensis]MBF4993287.1 hypothetical protein [Arthrobacter gandavensis]